MTPAQRAARHRTLSLQPWVAVLMAWPALMFFVPTQDWLIQLVGLRGAVFFIPFLLIGGRMEESDAARTFFPECFVEPHRHADDGACGELAQGAALLAETQRPRLQYAER